MRRVLAVAAIAAIAGVAALAGYRYAMHRMAAVPPPAAEPQAQAPGGGERRVLYWYDPMYPQHRFDRPGKSPFMDMQLVPKYADEASDEGTVAISPRVVQNLGVRTAEARMGSLARRVQAVGTVAYNERSVVQLQARAAGFVERLHARAPLEPVARGAPLAEILYPEWAGAQEEYLLLARHPSNELKPLAQAARRRLALLGMSEDEIEALERDGRARTRFTIAAPIAGVIAELGVREGMTVAPGTTLFRIVDLSTVWMNAEISEAQAAWVRPGSRVEARVAAYPEAVFEGRVGAILPEVNVATRTLRARIEIANPGGRLKPGMFATLAFPAERGRETVIVPAEAVIRTGARSVVIVALGEGRFRAAEVEAGFESDGEAEIRRGLKPGERVVLSGQFLIDSEANLTAALARLEAGGEPPRGAAAHRRLHAARGTVTDLQAAKGYVELDHEPVPALKWPKMTMGFRVEDPAQLARLKKGDAVEFEFDAEPDKDGEYVIRRIVPRPARRAGPPAEGRQ